MDEKLENAFTSWEDKRNEASTTLETLRLEKEEARAEQLTTEDLDRDIRKVLDTFKVDEEKNEDKNVNYILEQLNIAIQRYLEKAVSSVEAGEKYKDKVKDILYEMARVLAESGLAESGETQGIRRFADHLYNRVFRELHKDLTQRPHQYTSGERLQQRADAIKREVLQMPSSYFEQWNERLKGITITIESPHVGTRTKLTPKIKDKQFSRTGGAKTPEKKKVTPPAVTDGPFNVAEPLLVEPYKKCDQTLLLFQPIPPGESSSGDAGLHKMVYRKPAEEYIYRADDLMLLRQQARFWIEEFFNFILSPCDFANPPSIQSDPAFSKYRTQILVPLIKLVDIMTDKSWKQKEIQTPEIIQYLTKPIMTFGQWREYLSIQYPSAARVLFNENPDQNTRESQDFYKKYGKIIPTLQSIQEIFIGAGPTAPPRSAPALKPLFPAKSQISATEQKRAREKELLKDIEFQEIFQSAEKKKPTVKKPLSPEKKVIDFGDEEVEVIEIDEESSNVESSEVASEDEEPEFEEESELGVKPMEFSSEEQESSEE